MSSKQIGITLVRTNGGTQSRAEINQAVVAEYAEAMQDGAEFPPLVVFYDGEDYWLADGFHRYDAYMRIGKRSVPVEIHQGTRRDAILYSVGANARHGLRRTNADKRRAVMTLLQDPEWTTYPEREIARIAHVSHTFVQRVRVEHLATLPDKPDTREVTRNGTTYTQNTANIGKSKPKKEPDEEAEAKAEEEAEARARAEAVRSRLPDEVREMERRKEEAKAAKKAVDVDELLARVEELEETNATLERDYTEVIQENRKYEEMRVLFEKGGYEAVIAAKEEEIRVLKERLYSESEAKATWMRKAEYWKKQALKLGWRDERQEMGEGA